MYLYLKALHIIFIICWFSGLFYIVRLFVYYAEAQLKPPVEKQILSNQYKIMIHRLWFIITFPAAILATIFGLWLILENPYLIHQSWMHMKLLFVFLLWAYHLKCHQYVKQTQVNALKKSSKYFRLWNEGATLILFAVVFLVILKNAIHWIFAFAGLVLLLILLTLGYKWYQKIREKNNS